MKDNMHKTMRKVWLALLLTLVCVATIARNPLYVVNSKVALKQLMKEDVYATLVIDWSRAKYDDKKSATAEFGKDFAFIKNDCADKFIEGFNAKSKGIALEKNRKKVAYKFVIRVTNMDAYVDVMRGGQWESKVWGTLKIVKASNGATVAEVEIEEARNGKDYVRKESFGKTFKRLGEKVAKLK